MGSSPSRFGRLWISTVSTVVDVLDENGRVTTGSAMSLHEERPRPRAFFDTSQVRLHTIGPGDVRIRFPGLRAANSGRSVFI